MIGIHNQKEAHSNIVLGQNDHVYIVCYLPFSTVDRQAFAGWLDWR